MLLPAAGRKDVSVRKIRNVHYSELWFRASRRVRGSCRKTVVPRNPYKVNSHKGLTFRHEPQTNAWSLNNKKIRNSRNPYAPHLPGVCGEGPPDMRKEEI